MPELQIRRMRLEDLEAVHGVQVSAYPAAYHESPEALGSRLKIGAAYCMVAEQAGQVLAYVLAHAWRAAPPVLDRPVSAPGAEDHVLVHDLAVRAGHEGAALGSALYRTLENAAAGDGWPVMRLVALGQAQGFWQRQGYGAVREGRLPPGYGDAAWMEKRLG